MNYSNWSKQAQIARQLYQGESGKEPFVPDVFEIIEDVFPQFHAMGGEYLFDVMSRPGLSLREHSLVIIATLTAIRFGDPITGHMNWALNIDISREEVIEVIMRASQIGGWPSGDEIIRLIKLAYPGYLQEANNLGSIVSEPRLTVREQIMITLAALITNKFMDKAKGYIRWALDNGLSHKEILEVIIQLTPFAGWPTGVEAIRAAKEAFSSEE
ncbi:carboxymuconolactone decarboxylase family protein [Chloroflexota bacterium]